MVKMLCIFMLGVFKLEDKDRKFELEVKMRGQLQIFLKMEEYKTSKFGFLLRRGRLYFKGYAFFPWLKYENQLTLEGMELSVRDFFIDITKYSFIEPKLGQYKIPFTREYLTSSAALELVDRSYNHSFFNLGRDIGFSIHGEPFEGRLQYAIGIFNGAGKFTKRYEELDERPLFATRVVFSPLGALEKNVWKPKQGTFEDGFKVALGTAFVYTKYTISELENRADKSGLMKKAPQKDGELTQVTFDIALKSLLAGHGVSLEGDINAGRFNTSVTDIEAWGFRVQGGFFIIPKMFEIALRYAEVNVFKGGGTKDRIYEITTGPSIYILQDHRLKIQVDYSYGYKGIWEHLLRTQFQLYF
jgi:hypothetical protein